jgi:hypothetical protein
MMTHTPTTAPLKGRAGQIAADMRRAIATGAFGDSGFLPPERELTEQYATSRRTIAAALNHLADEGLVVRERGRGTRVVQPTPKDGAMAIRLIHWMNTTPNIHWMEGSELLRGMEEAIEPMAAFQSERYCFRADGLEQSVRMPDAPAPTVMLEAIEEQLPYVRQCQRMGIPVVVANLEIADPSIDATWTDHAAAMIQAVELLVQLGHRRIGYIGYVPSYLFYGRTEQAFVRSMRRMAGRCDESLVCHVERKVPAVLAGYQAAERMLRLDDPPTAIATTLDNFAEGAWSAIEQAGLTVGRDVSLIGYDDLTWSGDEPKLTTFREPAYEMGARAVQMVVDRVVNGPKPVEQVEFTAKLIMRRSVGPVPA